MSATTPDTKPCPKCSGTMYWIIITPEPAISLKGNEHLITMGYSCRGKHVQGPGCGYFEDHSPKKE